MMLNRDNTVHRLPLLWAILVIILATVMWSTQAKAENLISSGTTITVNRPVRIQANQGPKLYTALPVTLSIDTDVQDWQITLSTTGLSLPTNGMSFLESRYLPKIEPSDLYVAVGEDSEDNMLSMSRDITRTKTQLDGQNNFDLYFKANIDWHHIAGSYSGVVNILFEPIGN